VQTAVLTGGAARSVVAVVAQACLYLLFARALASFSRTCHSEQFKSLVKTRVQNALQRWMTWTCISVLLIAACAGAFHACEFGLRSSTHHSYATYRDATSSHLFCAICSFVHSPSLAGPQFSLNRATDSAKNTVAPSLLPDGFQDSFALSIRPPPIA
jgi:hypothetical protein